MRIIELSLKPLGSSQSNTPCKVGNVTLIDGWDVANGDVLVTACGAPKRWKRKTFTTRQDRLAVVSLRFKPGIESGRFQLDYQPVTETAAELADDINADEQGCRNKV